MFGWHAGGYIVPIRLHLQLVDDTFTGLLQPVTSDEEYILVLADSRMVLAASQTSLLMLGVRAYVASWRMPGAYARCHPQNTFVQHRTHNVC